METGDHNQGESNNIYVNQLGYALEGFQLMAHDSAINRGQKNGQGVNRNINADDNATKYKEKFTAFKRMEKFKFE